MRILTLGLILAGLAVAGYGLYFIVSFVHMAIVLGPALGPTLPPSIPFHGILGG